MNPALKLAIGSWPYRIALAGGWIDQPSINAHNRDMYGSMVTVRVAADHHFMDRSGIGTSTRRIALERFPMGPPDDCAYKAQFVEELYNLENYDKPETPSGSQDAVGIVYGGINRLDYGRGDRFPKVRRSVHHVQLWLEEVLYLLPIGPRPEGYNPRYSGVHVTPALVTELGDSGKLCFEAIQNKDLDALADSFNMCSRLWKQLMPAIFSHPLLHTDMYDLIVAYRSEYPGVMLSGCGGGYLLIVSDRDVPGAFKIRIV